MQITRIQFRDLTTEIADQWGKLPRSSRDRLASKDLNRSADRTFQATNSYDALYESGFLITDNHERELHENEVDEYCKGRQGSCLKISESFFNILETIVQDQIVHEKDIVARNRLRKKRKSQDKTKKEPQPQALEVTVRVSALFLGNIKFETSKF